LAFHQVHIGEGSALIEKVQAFVARLGALQQEDTLTADRGRENSKKEGQHGE